MISRSKIDNQGEAEQTQQRAENGNAPDLPTQA
jgi:hypothetical protein